ncbi:MULTISPECIES: hypothetical protein [Aerococcus]|uniref:Uncharacterized protein n=1 Tax=Aerococcus urinae TaxID=1376 RepID=A0A7T2RRH5_9LACT|nr:MULTISPECIES: hypothetical protein [Aerococcus]MCY3032149.1 hypothetical protein [Aerococcus urinae]MCY3037655.1 hypothetical protein [Aerococcus urinae]MCY3044195.1 hypothetical protein [Aerococcus urinae]MCY3045679.1 hypothetical protein [Aerococcus urinae]MCY3047650.1 hypothetical protein [Aerococcus urinae]
MRQWVKDFIVAVLAILLFQLRGFLVSFGMIIPLLLCATLAVLVMALYESVKD